MTTRTTDTLTVVTPSATLDDVERHARAILDALAHGDGGEATYEAGELLALVDRARRRGGGV